MVRFVSVVQNVRRPVAVRLIRNGGNAVGFYLKVFLDQVWNIAWNANLVEDIKLTEGAQ